MRDVLNNNIAAVILAAGLGKRMQSNLPKVLHKICDKPMVLYVIETARKIVGNNIVVVIGHQAETVRDIIDQKAQVIYAYQDVPLGTGHAVKCAFQCLNDFVEHVVILCGDVPFLSFATISKLTDNHKEGKCDITILGVKRDVPDGYGRINLNTNGKVVSIIEHVDASDKEKKNKLTNSGVYCIKKEFLKGALDQLNTSNFKGEYYLTDVVEIAHRLGKTIGLVISENTDELMGINTIEELHRAELILKNSNIGKKLDFIC
ncbi:MAG: NTP transferase domain-containing protein [Desulfobacterales bacterium]|nr:NTP transferase domain-containing protein [Desulfobacterales bacterium]